MSIKLYNTMTRGVDEFHPIEAGRVRLYTCGPTVYNYAHIGNLRTYVFEDILKRVLVWAGGYDVRHVMNVTDVGHLTDDADAGEDKMLLGARREGKSAGQIAGHYYDAFRNDMHRLNLIAPDVWCWATEHIAEQQAQVEALAERGYTYRTEDGVYFDTSKLADYGKLARLDKAGLRAGHRVDMAQKRNETDFALWKFSPPGRRRLMEWPNPMGIEGMGFPGWHIECSAMAIKYLGERLDIHCGGVDHINVHHTNEIAQAECTLGHEWCNWWMHGEFLTMPRERDDDGGKMSKSSGEFLTLDALVKKGYDPPAYRYFLLGAHYRQQLAFSFTGLDAAASAMKNLKRTVLDLRVDFSGDEAPIEANLAEFREALEDDLNAPRALAAMWGTLKQPGRGGGEIYATLLEMDKVLALGIAEMQAEAGGIDEAEIQNLIDERTAARKGGDFALADEIRDRLGESGIEIMDNPSGTTWRRR